MDNKCRAFTSLEQSRKLAEILPIESADMCYLSDESLFPKVNYNGMVFFNSEEEKPSTIIPCWSLAALINVISKHSSRLEIILRVDKKYNIFAKFDDFIVFRKFVDIDNAIDACVELIEKLHELKML